MSDLRTAAQQALEALESTQLYCAHEHYPRRRVADAITSLRAALKQPEQEPVAWRLPDPDPEGRFEWVLYQTADFMPGVNPMDYFDGLEPLFTHQPRREWRGLSKDESLKLWGMRSDGPSNLEIIGFARAIEAALKERNA
jgi:hypothetical protein